MHLTSQLILALVCLLACTSNFIKGHKLIILEEVITTLNTLTAKKTKDQCMELTVADVLAAPKNTTEKEAVCRAAAVLREIYRHHKCSTKRLLSKLDRNLSYMAKKTKCSVNETEKITLKVFLEKLKENMQEKYAKG